MQKLIILYIFVFGITNIYTADNLSVGCTNVIDAAVPCITTIVPVKQNDDMQTSVLGCIGAKMGWHCSQTEAELYTSLTQQFNATKTSSTSESVDLIHKLYNFSIQCKNVIDAAIPCITTIVPANQNDDMQTSVLGCIGAKMGWHCSQTEADIYSYLVYMYGAQATLSTSESVDLINKLKLKLILIPYTCQGVVYKHFLAVTNANDSEQLIFTLSCYDDTSVSEKRTVDAGYCTVFNLTQYPNCKQPYLKAYDTSNNYYSNSLCENLVCGKKPAQSWYAPNPGSSETPNVGMNFDCGDSGCGWDGFWTPTSINTARGGSMTICDACVKGLQKSGNE